MTSKKRRQHGSRTHSGGTHKNQRGTDYRGGRGRAGRDEHEFYNYGPLGKHNFERPDVLRDDVAEAKVQKLDENAALPAADGIAERDGDTYIIGARDVAEGGWEADIMKVLGDGQVRNELHVVANAFMAGAVELIGGAGGDAGLSERAEEAAETEESADTDEDDEE